MTAFVPVTTLRALESPPLSPAPSSPGAVTAFVFNDHPVFRSGLSWKLCEASGIEVIGDSGSLHDVIERAKALLPDAVIADLRIGDGDSEGVEAVEAMVAALPGVAVIVYSGFYSSSYRSRMERAGAAAFVMKSADLSKLTVATRDCVARERIRSAVIREAA